MTSFGALVEQEKLPRDNELKGFFLSQRGADAAGRSGRNKVGLSEAQTGRGL